jgi:hypothetical protein
MQEKELFFVIPTYRLRDVGETVEHMTHCAWREGYRGWFRAKRDGLVKFFLAPMHLVLGHSPALGKPSPLPA